MERGKKSRDKGEVETREARERMRERGKEPEKEREPNRWF